MTGRGALIIGAATALGAGVACLIAGYATAGAVAAFYAGWLAREAASIACEAATIGHPPSAPPPTWRADAAELADRFTLAAKLDLGISLDPPSTGRLGRLIKDMAAELDEKG